MITLIGRVGLVTARRRDGALSEHSLYPASPTRIRQQLRSHVLPWAEFMIWPFWVSARLLISVSHSITKKSSYSKAIRLCPIRVTFRYVCASRAAIGSTTAQLCTRTTGVLTFDQITTNSTADY